LWIKTRTSDDPALDERVASPDAPAPTHETEDEACPSVQHGDIESTPAENGHVASAASEFAPTPDADHETVSAS